jgi:hypothetical protein
MNGGSIRSLPDILGHYSVVMTERYAHLAPDSFDEKTYSQIPVSLEVGAVVPLEIGPGLGRPV